MREPLLARLARVKRGRVLKFAVPIFVVLASALLSVAAVENLPFLTNADSFVADWETAILTPAEPLDPDIVIVAIDEDTMAQLPYRAPIDRGFLADVLSGLAQTGPRAIGIDVLFDQPTEPAKDEALRRVLAGLKMPVRIAYTESGNVVTEGQKSFLANFVPPERRALVNVAEDQFDVVRWVYPGAQTRDGRYVMGFSRSLAEAVGVKTPAEQVPIVWRGRPAAELKFFPQFSAYAVKTLYDVKHLPADWFKDKVVLIGSDITLIDRHRTPYTTVFASTEGMLAGVVIQADALSQLLHHRSAPDITLAGRLAVALALGALGAVLGLSSTHIAARIGMGLLAIIGIWAGGAGLFHLGGPLMTPLAPTLSLAMSFFAMEAASGAEARAQRKFIEGVFSHHVAQEVVDQILSDPDKMTSLEGERREMTFVFTDIANFTTTSESMESRELARVLNAYLEGMAEIVQKHKGMVDKFIGDAVVAIFNAPIDLPGHAAAAVRCALEMEEFSTRFSKEQNEREVPFGLTRIGVHTGTAVVGNFGSRTRHNYTASGDAVNTAARLEGLNKYFSTRISVSGETRELCTGIHFRPTASVVLKGKSKAIEVWEPLPEGDRRLAFADRYEKAYIMLKQGSDGAADMFETLAKEAPDDPSLAFHLHRIHEGVRGVTVVMTDK